MAKVARNIGKPAIVPLKARATMPAFPIDGMLMPGPRMGNAIPNASPFQKRTVGMALTWPSGIAYPSNEGY